MDIALNPYSGRVQYLNLNKDLPLNWNTELVSRQTNVSAEIRRQRADAAFLSVNPTNEGRFVSSKQFVNLPDYRNRPNRLTPFLLDCISSHKPILQEDYLYESLGANVSPESGRIVVTVDVVSGEPIAITYRETNAYLEALGNYLMGMQSGKAVSPPETKAVATDGLDLKGAMIEIPGSGMSLRVPAEDVKVDECHGKEIWVKSGAGQFVRLTCDVAEGQIYQLLKGQWIAYKMDSETIRHMVEGAKSIKSIDWNEPRPGR